MSDDDRYWDYADQRRARSTGRQMSDDDKYWDYALAEIERLEAVVKASLPQAALLVETSEENAKLRAALAYVVEHSMDPNVVEVARAALEGK